MYLKNVKNILVFLFIFCSLNVTLLPKTSPDSRGFDVVVIVDQSGSMMGRSGAPNDSLGVRNDMVKRTFDLLVKDGILKKVTHRFGVVSFGDNAKIDLPLSRLTPSSEKNLRKKLEENLTGENLGYTHFLDAFRTAQRMMNTSPQAEAGKRILILITDGAPYTTGIVLSQYNNDMEEFVKSAFPHPDYNFHVIALNDPSSDYWKRYRGLWQRVSNNNAQKLEGDREHIFRAFHDVINNILGTSFQHIPPELYDNLVIPPYLESVNFDIFRANPKTDAEIYPADTPDTSLKHGSKNVDVVDIGKTIKTISVKKPTPGIWKIRKSGPKDGNMDVYTLKFFPRGKLLFPQSDKPVKQYEKVFVSYLVEDETHNPIQEQPGYPLSLELSLVKPDGSRLRMKMTKSTNPSEKSVFKTTEPITCDQPGTYRTEVLIATKDLKNKQVTLFKDEWSKFQVNSARLITCRLEEPKSMDNIPLYQNVAFIPRPLSFRFKFVDADGDPINIPAVFKGSHDQIIKVFPKTDGGENQLKINCQTPGDGIMTAQTHDLKNPGRHDLVFRPDSSQIPSTYTLQIVPDRLVITRHFSVLHWAQAILLGLLVLLTLGFLGHRFYLNKRYPIKGALLIERLGNDKIAEYNLNRKKHRLVLKDVPGETRIVKISLQAEKDGSEGINATVTGIKKGKKTLFLENRTIYDRGTAMLDEVPYLLRFRLN